MFSKFLSGLGKTLISLGLLTFLFVAFQLWGTGVEESQGQEDLIADLVKTTPNTDSKAGEAKPKATLASVTKTLCASDPKAKFTAPKEGQTLGYIEIPRIGVKKVFVEGTDTEWLKKGPGHYSDTPFPGTKGNAGIAGHRTTYGAPFNQIDKLQPGDPITVCTRQGRFVFLVQPHPADADEVVSKASWVVSPNDVHVLADKGDVRITLTACHPEFSAARRIIVTAVLDPKQSKEAPTVIKPKPATAKPSATDGKTEPTAAEAKATSQENLSNAFGESQGWNTKVIPDAIRWGVAAFAVWLVAFLIGLKLKRKRWISYLLISPAFFYCVWYGFTWLNRALPPL